MLFRVLPKKPRVNSDYDQRWIQMYDKGQTRHDMFDDVGAKSISESSNTRVSSCEDNTLVNIQFDDKNVYNRVSSQRLETSSFLLIRTAKSFRKRIAPF